jgi:hypothetical protein
MDCKQEWLAPVVSRRGKKIPRLMRRYHHFPNSGRVMESWERLHLCGRLCSGREKCSNENQNRKLTAWKQLHRFPKEEKHDRKDPERRIMRNRILKESSGNEKNADCENVVRVAGSRMPLAGCWTVEMESGSSGLLFFIQRGRIGFRAGIF